MFYDDDICFCGNADECPYSRTCLRAKKRNKPGIYTVANFYNADNDECEYYFEESDKNA